MTSTDELRALSVEQHFVLWALSQVEKITYSQDGECAWLWPGRLDLDDIGISNGELQNLRDSKLIAVEQGDPEDYERFGPHDVITDAGRALISQTEDDRHAK